MRRRAFLAALSLGIAPLGLPSSHAATEATYTPAAFAAAQQAGKPILMHVTAPWCPTCKAQAPILQRLSADAAFKDLVIFKVDFDTQKDVLRGVNAQSQSTLIVWRGTAERGRSAGDTSEASIRSLLQKSVN